MGGGCLAGTARWCRLQAADGAELPEQLWDAMDYTMAGGVGAVWISLPGAGGGAARRLSRAAFLEGDAVDRGHGGYIHGDRVPEPIEHLVGGVLQASVGLVKFAGRLGGELAEFIAVGNVGESSKDKI